ncbi:MAG: ABC transporter ATP-binding protein, partial [Staphylococcus epidermidis]|nr:ABC transporter ATP-binding protein [Staphylococcus epidermidis]
MIELRHISKSFKKHNVLEDISINIKNNCCTALIGKNGAGKSTLIDIIVGNNHYDSGQIADKSNLLNKHKMGILFQKTEFPKYIKVCELLHLYQSFYQTFISFHQFKEITQFSDRQMDQFACNLSGGQQRILDFALALVGKPELLILDEPTSGMDVEMRQHFWNVIEKLKMNNTTILYTSHYIEEVERMADQVMMLDKGKIQLDDAPENIKRNQSYSVIR